MSRIAHKVYFLNEEVRDEFIEMIRRAADFCGIELVSWCIMTNHFHLLVYLPRPTNISEEETLRRYGVLKGSARLKVLVNELSAMRTHENGEVDVEKRLKEIQRSMYNIGEFMKIVKQWLTQEYNRRYSHVGTLWESVYRDVLVKETSEELGKRAGYIHLNPIRAAITDDFESYPWSSMTALQRGDEVALMGMRHIYGPAAEKGEILEAHHTLMAKLLEQIKIEKAQDIASKRQAGFDVPADHLTTEALIAQESAHLEVIMAASIEDKAMQRRGRPSSIAALEVKIKTLLAQDPNISANALVKATGHSRSAVYRCLKKLRQA